MAKTELYNRLRNRGVRPSTQRLAIMEYLLTHYTHPTVDDVFQGLSPTIKTLSRTTVYNTLRMFAERGLAQMITIDDHRVCYDGNVSPHVHFFCNVCNKIIDLHDIEAPYISAPFDVADNLVYEAQLYYKGVCKACRQKGMAH